MSESDREIEEMHPEWSGRLSTRIISSDEILNYQSDFRKHMEDVFPDLKTYEVLMRRCDQDKIWIDQNGKKEKVSELEFTHARNLMAWLEKRGRLYHIAKLVEMSSFMHGPLGPSEGTQAAYDGEDAFDYFMEQDDVEVIKETKLYKALEKRVAEDPEPDWILS
jgi:hypothetical protein